MEFVKDPLTAIALICALLWLTLWVPHWISYKLWKHRVLQRQKWDLNICCGFTDGGGVNADIVKHADLPNFVRIDDVCNLPFGDKRFKHVLCSHTIEHVDEPDEMLKELKRVGHHVTIVLPPLWDITAAINIFEHRWIFFTFKKEHTNRLPPHVRLPFARIYHKHVGQKIAA